MTPTLTKKLWTEVTTSEHAHERAALHFIRERFPPREPFRAWANRTFIADDGTRNEVDLLVVSPTGVYLVEIKSHPGRMDGDAGTWVWTTPEGRRHTFDNPLLLAERKAKKLKSLLMRQRTMRSRRGPHEGFFLRSVVFLSDPGLTVGLNPPGRTDVYGPDPSPNADEQANDLPGLIKLVTRVDPGRGRKVDRPLSAAIADAVADAGIRESTTHRKVGIYDLGDLIDEGEGWQDFACVHPEMSDTYRRLRIYMAGRSVDEEERAALVRAAEREFRFLQAINHPAIDTPLELLQSPKGPVLVFRRDLEAERLDHWLADQGEQLDLLDRIELVRQLAEALRHAHRQGLYHRALSPRSVAVVQRGEKVVLRIQDWQTATRERSTSMSMTSGTLHVGDRVSEKTHVYLAPETLSVPDALAAPADIWSLGAVAVLILSGKAPAPDLDGLHEQLRTSGSLTLATAMDAPPSELDEIVRTATAVEASERFISVDEFLEFLDGALERLTAPDERDPLDANKGDTIEGRWTVLSRIGSGRTSIVFLAESSDGQEILKIARTDEHAALLRDEYDVLTKLRDRSIIEPYGLEEFGGRTVLRLEPALSTLGDELRKNGPLSLDLLERFGTDLIKAVAHLHAEGVAHRDIKPDNVGIAERGKDRERHLVLFDFSLARTDPAEIRVGTVGYLDPFLEERETKRWDDQAERYAVAVTLYEMTTGTKPAWGDGSTDPVLADREIPTLDTELFDPSVRDRLESFFESALHRRPESRFDAIADMLRAWEQTFSEAHRDVGTPSSVPAADVDLSQITPQTLLIELGVAPKVRNALDRLRVTTVLELAQIPPAELVRLGGIGATTRREVKHLAQRIRDELEGLGGSPGTDSISIDGIAGQLVPQPPADEEHRIAIAALLELAATAHASWPAYREVAEQVGLSRSVVGSALTSARERWRRRPDMTSVRGDISELLARRGGVMGADELAGLLLTARGSLASEPIRSRRARAVVRAAIETEAALKDPRFVAKRVGDALLIALSSNVEREDGASRGWDADRLVETAAVLGEVAEGLAGQDPLPSADQVIRALRATDLPSEVGALSDARLVRLAAAAAPGVSVSTRLELYPKHFDPAQALRESRSVLLDRTGLSASEVQSRVRARFPDVGDIPGRPQLDALVEPLGLTWSDGKYTLPSRGGILSTHISSTTRTMVFSSADERAAATRELDDRLAAVQSSGGFLALTVSRRRYAGSADVIAAAIDATQVDLDRMLLEGMHRHSDELGARWDAFLDADTRKADRAWNHLGRLFDGVLPELEQSLLQMDGVVVATGLGLLARYQRSAILERLRDALRHRQPDDGLRALILVVPGEDPTARPIVDGMPIPVITANQWAHVPSAWLEQNRKDDAA